MKHEKTLITLDFDGVISPIDASQDFTKNEEYKTMYLAGLKCSIRYKVLDFLKKLDESDKVDVIWVTSWQSITRHFHEHSEGLIPDFPHLRIAKSKMTTIYDYVEKEKYKKLHIFEDSSRVKREMHKQQIDRKLDVYSKFYKCKTEEGIKDAQIKYFESTTEL